MNVDLCRNPLPQGARLLCSPTFNAPQTEKIIMTFTKPSASLLTTRSATTSAACDAGSSSTAISILVALTVATASLLSACGGGGGGGGNGGTTVSSTTTVSAASSIVTSVTADAYGPGSEYKNAYNYLNGARSACGFGLLQDTNAVDNAAQAHANWLKNYNTSGHFEDPAKPTFYTGVTPFDRATAAGYAFSTYGEVTTVYDSTVLVGSSIGAAGIKHLFTAPYHGLGMLLGFRDIGIGYAVKIGAPGADQYWLNIDYGATASRPVQLLGGTTVATYPCAGSTGVLSKSYIDEAPQPIAGRNLQIAPIGTPIYVKVRDGQTLLLTSYTLQKVGSGVNENLLKLDKGSDANGQLQDNSAIILMPNAPLLTNTQYAFVAAGTNNGQAINISFTFTTGAF